MIEVLRYVVGALDTNCYLIKDKDSGKIAIVDPGSNSQELDKAVEENKDNIDYILLTHGHFDHIMCADRYRKISKAKIVISFGDKEFTNDKKLNLSKYLLRYSKGETFENFDADIFVKAKDVLKLGESDIKVIESPGHTRGGVCYIIENIIFSGDTIMKGTVGRTDFLTGSMEDMRKSCKLIANLNGEYTIYPGHGDKTTLQEEIDNNFYLGKSEL